MKDITGVSVLLMYAISFIGILGFFAYTNPQVKNYYVLAFVILLPVMALIYFFYKLINKKQ